MAIIVAYVSVNRSFRDGVFVVGVIKNGITNFILAIKLLQKIIIFHVTNRKFGDYITEASDQSFYLYINLLNYCLLMCTKRNITKFSSESNFQKGHIISVPSD